MSNDDFDNKGSGNAGGERRTDVSTPPPNLVNESRPSEQPSRAPKISNMPAVRMSGSDPGPEMSSGTKSALIPITAVLALGIGFGAAALYYGGRITEMEQELADTGGQFDECDSGRKACVTHLKSCVQDVDGITQSGGDLGLAPRNAFVERTRKHKETMEEEHRVQLDQVLEQAAGLTFGNKRAFKKSMGELKAEIADLKKLEKKLGKAIEEYKASVITSAAGPTGAPVQNATENNKNRTAYIAEYNSLEQASAE